jgi:hypothetical protein
MVPSWLTEMNRPADSCASLDSIIVRTHVAAAKFKRPTRSARRQQKFYQHPERNRSIWQRHEMKEEAAER